MAGLFETAGKALDVTATLADMTNDMAQTARVYTKDMRSTAKRDVARINARNEIKEDIKDLQWKANKKRVEALIKEATESGDWDKVDDLLEEL